MEHIHRVYDLVSKEFCNDVIDLFEKSSFKQKGASYIEKNGVVTKTNENNSKVSTDISIYADFPKDAEEVGESMWGEVVNYINYKLEKGVDSYMDAHPILERVQKFDIEAYNIQRYLPGEGFYNWHCENSGYKFGSNRIFAWMIYLNDLEDGGTEFQAQKHTEKAEAGKFLIWPAGWTHVHRGEVSQTKTKYIITGWYEYVY